MPSVAWAIASVASAAGHQGPTVSAAGEACAPVASAVAGSAAAASAALAVAASAAVGSGVRRPPWKDTYVALTFELQACDLRAADRTGLVQQGGQALGGKDGSLGGESTVPKTFASPSEAGAALLAAAQSGDRSACAGDLRPGWSGSPVHGRSGAGWDQSAGLRCRVHTNESLGTDQGGRPDTLHRPR